MDSLFGLVLLVALVAGLALTYKNRVSVAKWLNDPSLALNGDLKTRKRHLQRRIEDIEDEIEMIDEIESGKKNPED